MYYWKKGSESVIEPGFQKLEVWKAGIELVSQIYAVTKTFPKEEMYGLTSQIRRAAVSIPSNIAEGNSRRNQKEFQQYLYIALGSLAELQTQLIIGEKMNYVTAGVNLNNIENLINKVRAMILNLIKSLNSSRGTWSVVRGSGRPS